LLRQLTSNASLGVVATVFCQGDENAACRHLDRAVRALNGVTQCDVFNKPGRKSLLSLDEIATLKQYVYDSWALRKTLTVPDLRGTVLKKFQKNICADTFRKLICRHKIAKIVVATPIEEDRAHVSTHDIEDYYKPLAEKIAQVPPECVVNLDETGCQSWVDTQRLTACIPVDLQETHINFPLQRSGKRATLLVGITLVGDWITPLVIVQRSTIDTQFPATGYFEKAVFGTTESGFINRKLFIAWLNWVLVPYANNARNHVKRLRIQLSSSRCIGWPFYTQRRQYKDLCRQSH